MDSFNNIFSVAKKEQEEEIAILKKKVDFLINQNQKLEYKLVMIQKNIIKVLEKNKYLDEMYRIHGINRYVIYPDDFEKIKSEIIDITMETK